MEITIFPSSSEKKKKEHFFSANFYLIFFNKVRKGRKSSDMSSDFWSRSRGPSEYTTSPLKKQRFKIV